MTTLALASVKHAPGVTTTAVALASAWGGGAVVVEADPTGGDIAARARLPLEPGLLTLAASARHAESALDLHRHEQQLPGGGAVVVAPIEPELAGAAISTLAARLASTTADLVVIDCGRLSQATASSAAFESADLAVFVLEPTVSAVEHVRMRLASPSTPRPRRTAALLVGDRPYRPADVEHALGIPVLGAIAIDPRGVAAVHTGSSARRSLLVRSARSALDALQELLAREEARA
jgi:hypothetical protein